MRFLRAITSLCGCVGHVVQEAYCALGQKVAEQLEDVSDKAELNAEERLLDILLPPAAPRPADRPQCKSRG